MCIIADEDLSDERNDEDVDDAWETFDEPGGFPIGVAPSEMDAVADAREQPFDFKDCPTTASEPEVAVVDSDLATAAMPPLGMDAPLPLEGTNAPDGPPGDDYLNTLAGTDLVDGDVLNGIQPLSKTPIPPFVETVAPSEEVAEHAIGARRR